ncbi:MAG: CAAX prenyl protease-related protein [Chitinophagaceae bacterium]|nr:CAAX prenyl protease-related protein [Rubrivivax sp.]
MFGWRRAAVVRVAPFVVFMLFLAVRGAVPDGPNALLDEWRLDPRWLYGLQVLVVGAMITVWRREYGELARQTLPTLRETGLAITAGVVVFLVWIQLDAPWMTLDMGDTSAFVPRDAQGGLQWPLVMARWVGAALLVPVMEELFWRSFLMRWLQDPQFEGVLPQRVGLKAIVLSTFVFTLAHTLWLAAVLAGLAYAWLYVRTGKLWVAVIAHAVTNGVLGIWVVATGNWQFW